MTTATTTTTHEGNPMNNALESMNRKEFMALLERHGIDKDNRAVEVLWGYASDYRYCVKDIANACAVITEQAARTVHEINNGLRANAIGWTINAARRLPEYEVKYEMLIDSITKALWMTAVDVPDADAFRKDFEQMVYGTKP